MRALITVNNFCYFPRAALEHSQREGYALAPGVLTPEQVAMLRAASLEIFADEPLGPGDTAGVRLDVFSRHEVFRWLWEHRPFTEAHRKLALFVVCGRNNRGTRLDRQYIETRIDYGYLRGHTHTSAMHAIASGQGCSLL